MVDNPHRATKVDKELKRIVQLEKATAKTGRGNSRIGFGILFLVAVWIFTYLHGGGGDNAILLTVAALVGGYMAMTIGANDVANNVGPAVGSKALTMVGALVIAAIFEAAGAIIAGGEVVTTISKNIVRADAIADQGIFVWAMLAALLAAALWVHLATFLGAPISTTHSIVGAVAGAGLAAAGLEAVNWPAMSAIVASWIVSPVLGGVIAAAFLAFIKYFILYQRDRVTAAKRWVPILVAIMAVSFGLYLIQKGLHNVWKPSLEAFALIGVTSFAATYVIVRATVARAAIGMSNKRKSVSNLFTIPLICAAALLSFAHGSNDVANAVGPLAAIVSVIGGADVSAKVELPFWVLAMGGIGISIGLLLFGPKIIRIVGEKITRLDRARAFCVALSASMTVLVASQFGLPVSSTHIAVGAVFGVGFLREFLANRGKHMELAAIAEPPASVLAEPVPTADAPLEDGFGALENGSLVKSMKKARKRKLVRRSHLISIVAAWIVTVPISAGLAAGIFLVLSLMR